MNPDVPMPSEQGAMPSTTDASPTSQFLTQMWHSLGGASEVAKTVECVGEGNLPSVFCVSELATAAVGAAAAAVAELIGNSCGRLPRVSIDRRLSALWFGWSIRPDGWTLPATRDALAGDYPTADGWIRLHTNAPHHRAAALSTLGVSADKNEVAKAVARWNADMLETAMVEGRGCAAAMKSGAAWKQHPQGASVKAEPLVATRITDESVPPTWRPSRDRPLRGLRVLDLTRVLAGPVATRFLAGFGADVLRIDPLVWDEPAVVPEITLGKRCARMDLRDDSDRVRFLDLLRQAHVLVHGYRADALEALGLGAETRRVACPGLIDVSLCAYGWTGPWRDRRGFDSLVQMSAGIADAGMRVLAKDCPTPLPVQALDHATGYLMAAAVIRGLTQRLANGRGFEARTSLARTAELLISGPAGNPHGNRAVMTGCDFSEQMELTAFGPVHRLRPPVEITGASMRWDRPATTLGSSMPQW